MVSLPLKKRVIENRPISALIPFATNARTHSDSQIAQIAASIREFGWTNPVLTDGKNGILAGHGRVLAARKLGMTEVPCLELKDFSAAQKRAYVIADNKTALNAGWDEGLLAAEFGQLAELGFDLELTGFDLDEISAIQALAEAHGGLTDPDEAPDPPEAPISTPGDLWALGRHRVLCGDATSAADVERALGGVEPDMVYTDPPYGISIVQGASDGSDKGWVGGGARYKIPFRGKQGRVHGPAKKAIIEPGRYDEVIGDDSTDTAVAAYNICAGLSIPTLIFWGGNYYADQLPASRCWIAWDKENTGTFADVELAWTNLDRPARLFRHMWSGLMKASERGERRVHPTQKPVALAEWCFDQFGNHDDKVLDLFLGSASTLVACEQAGRTCYGMELSEAYIDVAVKRWQAFTGKEAMLDGKTFEEVAHARSQEAKPRRSATA